MALIFAVSSIPEPPAQGGGELRSYAAHFGEYAILALLVARGLGLALPERRGALLSIGAVLLAAAYGLSDEWHQSFVPNREASMLDAGFDAMGATFGATAWALVGAIRRRGAIQRSA